MGDIGAVVGAQTKGVTPQGATIMGKKKSTRTTKEQKARAARRLAKEKAEQDSRRWARMERLRTLLAFPVMAMAWLRMVIGIPLALLVTLATSPEWRQRRYAKYGPQGEGILAFAGDCGWITVGIAAVGTLGYFAVRWLR